jgi:hypothetical protein
VETDDYICRRKSEASSAIELMSTARHIGVQRARLMLVDSVIV